VAALAGVSIATVSRVLNGSERVNARLAERVRSACTELQYQPNRAARALAGGHSKTIGLMVTDVVNPFFMELFRGVEQVALRHGYLVILCNSAEDPQQERRYVEVLCGEPAAGAIVVPTSERVAPLQPFRRCGIPVVCVDRPVRDRHIDAVVIDNVGAARETVAHLIGNGYRRIAAITGPESTPTSRDRLAGYRLALRDAGIAHDPALERQGPLTEQSGKSMAEQLLSLRPPIEALFTGNNRLSMGVLEALHTHGLQVPDDLALACFDELPWVTPGFRSLTTVVQPAYELGSAAAMRLVHRMEHPDQAARQEIVLAHRFWIGQSSRPRGQTVGPTAPSLCASWSAGAQYLVPPTAEHTREGTDVVS
jgi:DNA-binding LacI/PurR family transcriptional regulator